MKKLLIFISAFVAVLFVSGCSKTDVTSRPGGGGEDDGEQVVEIIPAEGSVNLDEISDMIVSMEDDAIYFRLPEEGTSAASKAQTKVLPALLVPGAIAYALTPSERFPHGYLGRVVEVIEEEGGLVKALMERTTISESFDLFRVKGSFEMELETKNVAAGLEMGEDEDGFTCLTGSLSFSQEVGLKSKAPSAEGKAVFSAEGSITGGIKVHIDINQGLGVKDPYFRATADLKLAAELEFSASVEGTVEVPVPLGEISGKYVHPLLAILEPNLAFNAILIVEGSAGYSTGLSVSQTCRFGIANESGIWTCQTPELGNRPEIKTPGIDFSVSGEVFTGFEVPFSVEVCGREEDAVEISPKFGFVYDGTFSSDISDVLNVYEMHKETKIGEAVQLRLDAEARFGGKKIGKSLNWKRNFLEKDKYIFPTFECMSVEPGSNYVSVWYKAKRELLLPVSVATGVWTQDGASKVSESAPEPYAYIADTGFDFTGTHTGLESGTYKVRPVVRIGAFDIPADPETEFEVESRLIKSIKTSIYYESGELDYSFDRVYEYDNDDRVISIRETYDAPFMYQTVYSSDKIVFYAGGKVDGEYLLNEDGYVTRIIDSGIEKELTYGSDGYLKQCHYNTVSYSDDGERRYYEETTTYTYKDGNMVRSVQDSYTEITGSSDPDRNGSHSVIYTSDYEYLDKENTMSVNLMDDDFSQYNGMRLKGISSRCLISSVVNTSTDGYYTKAEVSYLPDENGWIDRMVIEYFMRNGERDGFLIYDIAYGD